MPTIIDSLVVTLNLDPRGFDEAQRAAINRLREIEQNARRTGRGVRETGSNVIAFVRGIENPLGALRAHFERLATATDAPKKRLADLAAQGRRAGTGVEEGALAGAAGLRVMGIAGIAAFATITALDKALKGANANAQRVFGAGVGAASAGIPIQEFTAISQALLKSGNVPEAETQSWLAGIKQFQEQGKISGYDQGRLTALAQASGNQINAVTDSPEEMLIKLARIFASLSPEAAVARGGIAGLSAAQSLALRNAGGGLSEQIAAERRRAATEHQSESAGKLLRAQNDLSNEWSNLSRIIWDDVNPAMLKFTEFMTTLVKLIEDFPLIQMLTGFPAALGTGGASVTGPMSVGIMKRIWGWLTGKPMASLSSGGGGGGGGGTAGTIDRNPTGSDVTSYDEVKKFWMSKGAPEHVASAIAKSVGVESNYRLTVPGDHGSSIGLYQEHNERMARLMRRPDWRTAQGQNENAYAEVTGGDAIASAHWQEILHAPDEVTAYKLWRHYFGRGIDMNNPILPTFRTSSSHSAHTGTTDGGSGRGRYVNSYYGRVDMRGVPGVKYNSRHEPYSAELDTMSPEMKARVAQSMAAIKKYGFGSSGDTTNTNVNVGAIHVHTKADSATGIAAAGMIAAKGAAMVNPSNSGLQ